MAKISFYIIFFFTALTSNAQNSRLVASCCYAKPKEEGRCTGSAYCSACSNCSRCGHCSSGGSCGVCASYAAPARPAPTRTVRKRAEGTVSNRPMSLYSNSSAGTDSKAVSNLKTAGKGRTKKEIVIKKTTVSYVSGEKLAVESEILNLREEAGEGYPAIEVLKKHDRLLLIAQDGEWLQVQVISSGNYGYVKAQHVYKI